MNLLSSRAFIAQLFDSAMQAMARLKRLPLKLTPRSKLTWFAVTLGFEKNNEVIMQTFEDTFNYQVDWLQAKGENAMYYHTDYQPNNIVEDT